MRANEGDVKKVVLGVSSWLNKSVYFCVHPKETRKLEYYQITEPDQLSQVDPEDSILLTDRQDFCQQAGMLNIPVLVYFHEDNGDQSFAQARYGVESLEQADEEYLTRVFRRYHGIPWDILETERCIIREIKVEDANALYEIYGGPGITEHMEGLLPDPEEEKAFIRDYIDKIYAFYEFGMWIVEERETGQVIGRAGLNYRQGYEDPEMGYVIAAPFQKKGYATEVCQSILNYGRDELGFSQIRALVEPENTASIALCRKLGFYFDRIVYLGNVPMQQFLWGK